MRNRAWVSVAKYTFLEGVRARFFIGVLAVGVALVLLAAVLGVVPYGKTDQLITRIGWGAILLTGLTLSILDTIQHLAGEYKAKTLHLMLSKPISRPAYAWGKAAGICLLVISSIAIEGALLIGALAYYAQEAHNYLFEWFVPVVYISLKCIVLIAFSGVFATLFSPLVAAFAAVTFFLVGAGSEDLYRMALQSEMPVFIAFGAFLRWLAPQFSVFDIEGWVAFGIEALPSVYWHAAGYYAGYFVIGVLFWQAALALRELE